MTVAEGVEIRWEVRSSMGARVGSYTSMQAAIDFCRTTNANRDQADLYVVVQAIVPTPIPQG